MAINIQNLLNGDSITQIVEKINFNFDQVILAGGGPAGPRGLQGLRGPAGAPGGQGFQGEKGKDGIKWIFGSGSPEPNWPTQSGTINLVYPSTVNSEDINEGDMFFDTGTSKMYVYEKSVGAWKPLDASTASNYFGLANAGGKTDYYLNDRFGNLIIGYDDKASVPELSPDPGAVTYDRNLNQARVRIITTLSEEKHLQLSVWPSVNPSVTINASINVSEGTVSGSSDKFYSLDIDSEDRINITSINDAAIFSKNLELKPINSATPGLLSAIFSNINIDKQKLILQNVTGNPTLLMNGPAGANLVTLGGVGSTPNFTLRSLTAATPSMRILNTPATGGTILLTTIDTGKVQSSNKDFRFVIQDGTIPVADTRFQAVWLNRTDFIHGGGGLYVSNPDATTDNGSLMIRKISYDGSGGMNVLNWTKLNTTNIEIKGNATAAGKINIYQASINALQTGNLQAFTSNSGIIPLWSNPVGSSITTPTQNAGDLVAVAALETSNTLYTLKTPYGTDKWKISNLGGASLFQIPTFTNHTIPANNDPYTLITTPSDSPGWIIKRPNPTEIAATYFPEEYINGSLRILTASDFTNDWKEENFSSIYPGFASGYATANSIVDNTGTTFPDFQVDFYRGDHRWLATSKTKIGIPDSGPLAFPAQPYAITYYAQYIKVQLVYKVINKTMFLNYFAKIQMVYNTSGSDHPKYFTFTMPKNTATGKRYRWKPHSIESRANTYFNSSANAPSHYYTTPFSICDISTGTFDGPNWGSSFGQRGIGRCEGFQSFNDNGSTYANALIPTPRPVVVGSVINGSAFYDPGKLAVSQITDSVWKSTNSGGFDDGGGRTNHTGCYNIQGQMIIELDGDEF